MDKGRKNIAMIAPSEVLCEGLSNIILKGVRNSCIFEVKDFNDIEVLLKKNEIESVIIDPNVITNREHEFNKFKCQYPNLIWIGILNSVSHNNVKANFDGMISIFDSSKTIIHKLNNCSFCSVTSKQQSLTEREIEVLVELVNGLSNKQIAEKLKISIHTVISHRKNISEKTGIKSLPGLTMYAISQNLTSMSLQ